MAKMIPRRGRFGRQKASGGDDYIAPALTGSGMDQFIDDDAGYLDWITTHPDNYVINAERRPKAGYLRLHLATCRFVTGTPAHGQHWTKDYIKICGDEATLRAWARNSVGGDVQECPFCMR